MTVNIVDVDTFTDPVVAPSGGDIVKSSGVTTPVQGLANRTRYLKNDLEVLTTRVNSLTSQTSVYLTEWFAQDWFPGSVSPPEIAWDTETNNAFILFPIRLRKNDVITQVSGLVFQGNNGSSGRMTMQLWRQTPAASGVSILTQVGSTVTFTAGAGFQTGSITVSSNGTIDTSTHLHFMKFTASSLASTISDRVNWSKVTYTPVGA